MEKEEIGHMSFECERLIDECAEKLSVLSVAFESMGDTKPKVNFVFWDGLKNIYNEMISRLIDAHEFTDKIRSHAEDAKKEAVV